MTDDRLASTTLSSLPLPHTARVNPTTDRPTNKQTKPHQTEPNRTTTVYDHSENPVIERMRNVQLGQQKVLTILHEEVDDDDDGDVTRS